MVTTRKSQITAKQKQKSRRKKIVRVDWETSFQELKVYKERHGDCLVPRQNSKLGRWVNKQRAYRKWLQEKKATLITKEKINKLNGVGFVWKVRKTTARVDWETKFQELKVYYEQHRNCLVPQRHPRLGQWVSRQRVHYKRLQEKKSSPMTNERITKLNSIGFVWKANTTAVDWETRFEELNVYKQQHGNCLVPLKHPKLGQWVDTQRVCYKRWQEKKSSPMTNERITKLNSIGFVWKVNPNTENWETRFQELKVYYEQHRNCLVPRKYPKLGQWVHHQRVHYKRLQEKKSSQMTNERITKLNSIGFAWDYYEWKANQSIATTNTANTGQQMEGWVEDKELLDKIGFDYEEYHQLKTEEKQVRYKKAMEQKLTKPIELGCQFFITAGGVVEHLNGRKLSHFKEIKRGEIVETEVGTNERLDMTKTMIQTMENGSSAYIGAMSSKGRLGIEETRQIIDGTLKKSKKKKARNIPTLVLKDDDMVVDDERILPFSERDGSSKIKRGDCIDLGIRSFVVLTMESGNGRDLRDLFYIERALHWSHYHMNFGMAGRLNRTPGAGNYHIASKKEEDDEAYIFFTVIPKEVWEENPNLVVLQSKRELELKIKYGTKPEFDLAGVENIIAV